jgi:hypothetical protein
MKPIMRIAKGTPFFVFFQFRTGGMLHTDDLLLVWPMLLIVGLLCAVFVSVSIGIGLVSGCIAWIIFALTHDSWSGPGVERLQKEAKRLS